MQKQKPWYQSKAVIGGIVAVLASIAAAFGYAVSPESQGEITNLVVAIAGGVGGLLAVYGRIKAKDKIK